MRLNEIYLPIQGALDRISSSMLDEARSLDGSQAFSAGLSAYMTGAVAHLVSRPGKMLRPALVLLSSRLIDETNASRHADPDEIIALAAAVEFFHTASLAHDDIIDADLMRRDQATLNGTYGNHAAVLVGDILYAKFFSLITGISRSSGVHEILSIFCSLTERMCAAELGEQRIIERGVGADDGEYLTILQYKTADLMAACCEAAAVLSGAPRHLRASLADFGRAFGMAFQLFDDLADGDSISRPTLKLRDAAVSYLSGAEAALAAFPDCSARESLSELCAFIGERETSVA